MTGTKDQIIEDAVKSSKDKRNRLIVLASAVVAVACLILTFAFGVASYMAVMGAARDGQALAEEVQGECSDPDGSIDSRDKLCEQSEDTINNAPDSIQGNPGPQGAQGDPGVPGSEGPPPTDAQVANAVALYCAVNTCKGRNGSNATASQVAEAVASYCDAQGQCRGPSGSAGATGQDGATGPQGETGETGPAPSTTQIETAVMAYCAARNDCRGDTGAEGPAGPTGVVNVVTDCNTPTGQVIENVVSRYDASERTIFIQCTFKPDQTLVN